MLEPSMQELTTEQAKGLQVALHAEDASGPFSFPQASSLTKLKKAVSQAVGSALNVAQSPKSTVDRRNEANMSALGQILRSKYYRPSKVQVLSQMPCCPGHRWGGSFSQPSPAKQWKTSDISVLAEGKPSNWRSHLFPAAKVTQSGHAQLEEQGRYLQRCWKHQNIKTNYGWMCIVKYVKNCEQNHEPRCSHLWTYENTLNLTMENHHC